MANRKLYSVATDTEMHKLNVRETPSLSARVIGQFSFGDKIRIDPKAKTPDGWAAVESGGFVMAKYIK